MATSVAVDFMPKRESGPLILLYRKVILLNKDRSRQRNNVEPVRQLPNTLPYYMYCIWQIVVAVLITLYPT